MSNLRLINETSASSVSSISVTDVFSADFDIYKVIIKNVDTTAENYTYMRFINSSGSIVTASNYNYATQFSRSYNTFTEVRSTNDDEFTRFGVQDTGAEDGGSTVAYIFNPYSSSSYSFFINQHSGQGSLGQVGMKGIGVLKQTASMGGMQFYPASGTYDTVAVQIFGLRVDS
jgi:hypothetical protein